ncbi:hypothetical protein CY34DRAFT_802328 [Suillus luteus UH-Slu-Lm8-n1]|uniref:Uncharacterized protein n=1 Tax=Suillus luteus UH-Slu-Lm8-n1 TaxID=930992 RepID=A0A0D0A3X2_9AGAM|nr:hypothetical protein CY34DRAFT_802328 [Suillus luteus UH-Slu-Lm8-n1]
MIAFTNFTVVGRAWRIGQTPSCWTLEDQCACQSPVRRTNLGEKYNTAIPSYGWWVSADNPVVVLWLPALA